MAFLLGVLQGGVAEAGMLVRAMVLPDPGDGEPGVQLARQVEERLRASGRYLALDRDMVEGRVGEGPAALHRRCGSEPECWRRAAAVAGADQVVLVDRLGAEGLGVRVVDTAGNGGFRMGTTAASGSLRALLDDLFFEHGTLRLWGAPPGAVLVLDGQRALTLVGALELALPGGRHTLEVQAEGHLPLFATVMIRPGEATEFPLAMPRDGAGRRRVERWTTFFALGLAAGGAVATHAASRAPARGVEP